MKSELSEDYVESESYKEAQEQLKHPRKTSIIFKYPIGSVVDDMVVLDYLYEKIRGLIPVCRCNKCGRLKKITKGCLDNRKGTSHSSCGQGIKDIDKKFHRTWMSMKQRIYNPNYARADRYSGRGLTCDYDSFIDFYDDMYESYLEFIKTHPKSDTSIDRIDNDLGYVRGNLRWATQKMQVNNSSKMRYFKAKSPDGEVYYDFNQRDFAKRHSLSDKQISAVLAGRFRTTLGWKFKYISKEQYLAKLEKADKS